MSIGREDYSDIDLTPPAHRNSFEYILEDFAASDWDARGAEGSDRQNSGWELSGDEEPVMPDAPGAEEYDSENYQQELLVDEEPAIYSPTGQDRGPHVAEVSEIDSHQRRLPGGERLVTNNRGQGRDANDVPDPSIDEDRERWRQRDIGIGFEREISNISAAFVNGVDIGAKKVTLRRKIFPGLTRSS
jgi:hypothetical protein